MSSRDEKEWVRTEIDIDHTLLAIEKSGRGGEFQNALKKTLREMTVKTIQTALTEDTLEKIVLASKSKSSVREFLILKVSREENIAPWNYGLAEYVKAVLHFKAVRKKYENLFGNSSIFFVTKSLKTVALTSWSFHWRRNNILLSTVSGRDEKGDFYEFSLYDIQDNALRHAVNQTFEKTSYSKMKEKL